MFAAGVADSFAEMTADSADWLEALIVVPPFCAAALTVPIATGVEEEITEIASLLAAFAAASELLFAVLIAYTAAGVTVSIAKMDVLFALEIAKPARGGILSMPETAAFPTFVIPAIAACATVFDSGVAVLFAAITAETALPDAASVSPVAFWAALFTSLIAFCDAILIAAIASGVVAVISEVDFWSAAVTAELAVLLAVATAEIAASDAVETAGSTWAYASAASAASEDRTTYENKNASAFLCLLLERVGFVIVLPRSHPVSLSIYQFAKNSIENYYKYHRIAYLFKQGRCLA